MEKCGIPQERSLWHTFYVFWSCIELVFVTCFSINQQCCG
uniref:Uncharacterized protein n=1 Tax=Arundo donax TaxID=35708 RepID=A0A0A9C861_ARUDO